MRGWAKGLHSLCLAGCEQQIWAAMAAVLALPGCAWESLFLQAETMERFAMCPAPQLICRS